MDCDYISKNVFINIENFNISQFSINSQKMNERNSFVERDEFWLMVNILLTPLWKSYCIMLLLVMSNFVYFSIDIILRLHKVNHSKC